MPFPKIDDFLVFQAKNNDFSRISSSRIRKIGELIRKIGERKIQNQPILSEIRIWFKFPRSTPNSRGEPLF